MVWELVAYQWTLHKEPLWLAEVWLLLPVQSSVLGDFEVNCRLIAFSSVQFSQSVGNKIELFWLKHNFPQKLFGVVFFFPNGLYLHHWNVLPAYISSLLSHFKIYGSWVDASTCYRISSKGLHTPCLWLFTCSYVFFSLNNLILYNTGNSFLAFSCATSLIWSICCFSGGVIFIYNWNSFHIPFFSVS